ncbi:glycosyltransferase [Desulfovibrio piger]|nr:glycosyltransferase [Desulfovibrio piger]
MSHFLQHSLCIQNVVFNGIQNAENLFVRGFESGANRKRCSTDTYINMFHYARWRDLTGFDEVSLHVLCEGKGSLFLYGVSSKIGEKQGKDASLPVQIAFYNVNNPEGVSQQWSICLNKDYDFFFLAWEYEKDNYFNIEKAYYEVPYQSFKRDVKIAIVATTFNRSDDIALLARTYASACQHDSYFNTASHLFIINNEYKDKDVLSQYEQKNITVVNNKENFGGSGGFTQGARLAVERGEFSHVLFMDDDAFIHEESWFRTVALLRCLRDELCDHPVSGTMFTREQPSYCHAAIEALNKHLHRRCLSGAVFLDTPEACRNFLTAAHETCRQLRCTEGQVPYPYAAWWYCLFPTAVFVQHGYPESYFLCGDDIEFGLRIKKSPLFLNGICVWHPAFENKTSPLREYLSLRNYALRCTAHMKGWRYQLIKMFFRKMARCLAANDYERAALTLLAIRDFMDFAHVPREGSQLIARVEIQRQRWANARAAREKVPFPSQQIAALPLRHNLLPMLGVFLTLGGVLVPPFLRRRHTVAPFLQVGGRWVSQWTAYPESEISQKFQNISAARLTIKAIMQIYSIIKKRG